MHSPAFALTTQQGSICKPYANVSPTGLSSQLNGIYNFSGAAMNVICPVVRTAAAPAGGFSVWVDGNASSGTAYCYLYSYNYNQQFMGATSFTATGTFSNLLTLPQSQVPTYSSQAVFCGLPNGGGIFDVEPVQ